MLLMSKLNLYKSLTAMKLKFVGIRLFIVQICESMILNVYIYFICGKAVYECRKVDQLVGNKV